MNEIAIRHALIQELEKNPDNCHGIIIEELGICRGSARIDLAVINSSFHGYEIKSESDSFKRLESQILYYSRCFEYVTLVISSKHVGKSLSICPDWWGITEVKSKEGKIEFFEHTTCRKNPSIDPNAIVQLLWKEEAASALINVDNEAKTSGMTRTDLWMELVDRYELEQLCSVVKEKLISRNNWREHFLYD